MWEKSVNQRLLTIGLVLVFAALILWRNELRPGLDIAGGFSMIFEIEEDATDPNPAQTAEDMKRLLQKRVDPQGVIDDNWRVIGANRIEVQIPLPPPDSKKLRDEHIAAREALFEANVERSDLERLFAMPPEARGARSDELARGDAGRAALIRTAVERYDELVRVRSGANQAPAQSRPAESQPADSQPASQPDPQIVQREASEALEDAIDHVMETNLDPQRFQDVIDLDATSPIRKASLQEMRERFPGLADKISAAVNSYEAWREKRAFLEGPADLRRLLRGAGVLEFRILAEPSPENITKYDRYRTQLQERGPSPAQGDDYQWFRIDNPIGFLGLSSQNELEKYNPRNASAPYVVERRGGDWFVLSKRGAEHGLLHSSGGSQWRLTSAYVSRDQSGRRSVGFDLDVVGGSLFAKLTGANINKQLCILVDDVAYSSANIMTRISSRGQITGDFSVDKINYLIQTMQAGSLPARLKDTPVSERTIGSSLGEENLHKAFRAGVIGVICVMIFMMVYYGLSGAIANVALLMNIALVLAAMAMLGARFTLPGIAGVILTIGMTVDANVLIFERMREERERGASLRMMIKNGYDKALSTIVDANITTLLTSMVIYYVGSEEIKGFGLTVGWGIVTSLFTALFVTRTLFTLLVKRNLITDIKMMRMIGVPNIDWYGKRHMCLGFSAAIIVIGMGVLLTRPARDILDVEFLGGVNAEIELKKSVASGFDDLKVRSLLQAEGDLLKRQGRELANASVTPVPNDATAFRVQVNGLDAATIAAMITEPLEETPGHGRIIRRDGVDSSAGGDSVRVRVEDGVSADVLREAVQALGAPARIPLAGDNIARANIGAVTETAGGDEKGRFWNLTTTVTNKKLVQHAMVRAFGDNLQTQQSVSFVFHGAGDQPYPVTNRRLDAVVPDLPAGAHGDLTDYLGGAAIHLADLQPPQTVNDVTERLRSMRLQPDYAQLPWRKFEVYGVESAGADADGRQLYSGIVIAVVDPAHNHADDPQLWASEFAGEELALAKATLDQEQTLRRVTQFKPQIAAQAQTRAILALLLSWVMIIGYVWIRFGRPIYGIGGVAALVHDALIALSFLGFASVLGKTGFMLVSDFKIDMTVVAAILTVIGYSINDTIVIFDRIRETRGRLGGVTPEIINHSINQCMARTLLTSMTTFAVVLVMYIWGGPSIRAFNYVMLIGVITGVYSTIAIATPPLMWSYAQRRRPQAVSAVPRPA